MMINTKTVRSDCLFNHFSDFTSYEGGVERARYSLPQKRSYAI
jgi:hypothetical protein